MPVCPLCPVDDPNSRAVLLRVRTTRVHALLWFAEQVHQTRILAYQDSIRSHERTCGPVVGKSSGMLPTRVETLVEPWCHIFFSRFFSEKAGYMHTCAFGALLQKQTSLPAASLPDFKKPTLIAHHKPAVIGPTDTDIRVFTVDSYHYRF